MSKVSIIVPAYNCEKYIERCLISILNQQGVEIEVIVINDGSTDATLDVLQKFEDSIVIKTVKNGGVANARNFALDMVSGDFVMFVDADDYLEEGAISELINKQNEYNADIVRFRYRKVYSNAQTDIPKYQPDFERKYIKNEFKENVYPYFIRGIALNSVCFSMFKKEVVKGIRFRQDMHVAEDAVYSLNAFTNAQSVLFLPNIFYNYYTSDNSLTGSSISIIRKYMDNYKFAFETIKKLKKWDMNTFPCKIKCLLRPILLTFDKMQRMKKLKDVENSNEKS